MKKHISRLSVASTLLLSLFLFGCGGGGSGGGGSAGTGTGAGTSTGTGTGTGESNAPVDNEAPQPANNPAGQNSSTITWLPPTNNADESALTDMVGYKIYIGSEPGRYETVRMLKEPGITEYSLENLPAGTYYVAMTAVNSKNIESALSNVVVRVVSDS